MTSRQPWWCTLAPHYRPVDHDRWRGVCALEHRRSSAGINLLYSLLERYECSRKLRNEKWWTRVPCISLRPSWPMTGSRDYSPLLSRHAGSRLCPTSATRSENGCWWWRGIAFAKQVHNYRTRAQYEHRQAIAWVSMFCIVIHFVAHRISTLEKPRQTGLQGKGIRQAGSTRGLKDVDRPRHWACREQ